MVITMTVVAAGAGEAAEPQGQGDDLSWLNPSGLPIVNEPVSYDLLAPRSPTQGDWNKMWVFDEMERRTGIRWNIETVDSAGWSEKKSLAFATGELPDFFMTGLDNFDVINYGSQGVLTPLSELIDEYAPNITSILEARPDIRKSIAAPDGRIYHIPSMNLSERERSQRRSYINTTWLDNLGLEIPETIDEFYDVLRAFKDEDANLNGDPNDEWPIYYHSGHIAFAFERQLLGSYGLGNRGGQASGGMLVDMGPNGKVRFIPTDNRYKELWQQISRWWEEDLMQTETFAGGDYASWVADGAKDVVGFFSWVHPFFLGNEVGNRFTGITALEGPHGDAILTWIEPPVRGVFSYMITVENKYPVESTKWVDYFYGPEGSLFGYYGEEGVTYNIVNGKPQYIDAIKNYEGGVQLGSFQWVDNVYGGYYPMLDIDVPTRMEIQGKTVQYEFKVSADDHEIFMPDDLWTAFPATPEESEELSALLTDINAYINEMRPRFITGELNFGADWDDYVATLNRMGAGRYLEIRQKQYERYSK